MANDNESCEDVADLVFVAPEVCPHDEFMFLGELEHTHSKTKVITGYHVFACRRCLTYLKRKLWRQWPDGARQTFI